MRMGFCSLIYYKGNMKAKKRDKEIKSNIDIQS